MKNVLEAYQFSILFLCGIVRIIGIPGIIYNKSIENETK